MRAKQKKSRVKKTTKKTTKKRRARRTREQLRKEILDYLKAHRHVNLHSLTLHQLSQDTDIAYSSTNNQVRALEDAGKVRTRKKGRRTFVELVLVAATNEKETANVQSVDPDDSLFSLNDIDFLLNRLHLLRLENGTVLLHFDKEDTRVKGLLRDRGFSENQEEYFFRYWLVRERNVRIL